MKEVIPEAITIIKSFIPSEQKFLENFEWKSMEDSKDVLLSTNELTDVANTTYKFYVSNSNNYKEKEIAIKGNEDDTFTFDQTYQTVYVYGKQVDDFNMLNKHKIFGLYHACIQELDQQQEKDRETISTLEHEHNTLKEKVNTLESQINTVLQRLETLEN